jgi:hypothetical protein
MSQTLTKLEGARFPGPSFQEHIQISQQHFWRLFFGDECIDNRCGTVRHIDLTGKHDDRDVGVRTPNLAGYRLPVHLWHTIVQNHKMNGVQFEESQTDPAAAGCDHGVASNLQHELAEMEILLVIVDTQDKLLVAILRRHLRLRRHRAAHLSRTIAGEQGSMLALLVSKSMPKNGAVHSLLPHSDRASGLCSGPFSTDHRGTLSTGLAPHEAGPDDELCRAVHGGSVAYNPKIVV